MAGHLLALDRDGRRLWSATVAAGLPSGPPAVLGDALYWLGRDGVLERLSLADGTRLDRTPLDVLPAGGPLAIGNALAVPVAPGSICIQQQADDSK